MLSEAKHLSFYRRQSFCNWLEILRFAQNDKNVLTVQRFTLQRITQRHRGVCLRRQWIRAWKYRPGHFSSGNNPLFQDAPREMPRP
jgi:hypothetical protein